ncbi:alcohol dehydrogenase catalytic domain-containing protein [Halorientalis halophila]|uniref:alcohol dehydrogenase catalytic domain-containing protein n=1 Tax=Halorientalis halophila TaxID=3108499 RepID=UPI0030097CB7
MRAAVYPDSGDPADIDVETVPDPEPEPGEAVVRVEACSVNHRDLWKLDGTRETGDQFVGGADVAGVVERIEPGEGEPPVAVGDRVLLCPLQTCGTCRYCREGPENYCAEYDSFDGGFAERCAVDAHRLIELPDGVDVVAAATLPIASMTAWRMLERADVTAGDRVFVPGATGGVGVATIQLAGLRGAETVGTSTSARKLERLADLGCDHTIETGDPDEMVERVGELGPVDATINHLGGPFGRAGMEVLRRGGTQVVCGRTAGPTVELDLWDTYFNHKDLLGSTLGTQPDLERVLDFLAAGEIEAVVHDTYPLAETAAAFRDMSARDLFGNAVVTPGA